MEGQTPTSNLALSSPEADKINIIARQHHPLSSSSSSKQHIIYPSPRQRQQHSTKRARRRTAGGAKKASNISQKCTLLADGNRQRRLPSWMTTIQNKGDNEE